MYLVVVSNKRFMIDEAKDAENEAKTKKASSPTSLHNDTKKSKRKNSALCVPTWSPTVVLIEPGHA